MVPLFRLVPGRSQGSLGFDCARRAALSADVIERAELVDALRRSHTPILSFHEPWIPAVATYTGPRTPMQAKAWLRHALLALLGEDSDAAVQLARRLARAL